MLERVNMELNIDDLYDSKNGNQFEFYESIWARAEECVKSGGVFVIQQEYTNAPPDLIYRITCVEELRRIKKKFDENI